MEYSDVWLGFDWWQCHSTLPTLLIGGTGEAQDKLLAAEAKKIIRKCLI